MNFGSDNWAAVHPAVLAAMAAANQGFAPAYGNDPWTEELTKTFSALFEREVAVFPVATGTAANSLSLSLLTPPTGVVFCHSHAHVYEDECGAPEFYTGGAKLFPLPGEEGRVSVEALQTGLNRFVPGFEHHQQPASLSLTQATEAGTVYSIEQITALAALAHENGCKVHMDGARFANALATLDVSPAEMTWKAGVDILSFGATKNGCMAAEAVVVFDPETAAELHYRRMRGGHLWSKQRFLSAQLTAYVTNNLWLENAHHANRLARKLGNGLAAMQGFRLAAPVQINEVFVDLPAGVADTLRARGFMFHDWSAAGPGGVRFVTSFMTDEADVDAILQAAADQD